MGSSKICELIDVIDDNCPIEGYADFEECNLNERLSCCESPDDKRAELNYSAERVNKLELAKLICDTVVKILKIAGYVYCATTTSSDSEKK